MIIERIKVTIKPKMNINTVFNIIYPSTINIAT